MRIMMIIDFIVKWTAKLLPSVCVFLIAVMSYEVIMRYVFDSPTSFAYDVSRMMGATIIVLGWAYVHQRKEHIRVDVLYIRLSNKGKAMFDAVLTVIFFFPLISGLVWFAATALLDAFRFGEVLVETTSKYPAWPIRSIYFIGVSLLLLQGIVTFVRDLQFLVGKKAYD